jgi:hypothetical protein
VRHRRAPFLRRLGLGQCGIGARHFFAGKAQHLRVRLGALMQLARVFKRQVALGGGAAGREGERSDQGDGDGRSLSDVHWIVPEESNLDGADLDGVDLVSFARAGSRADGRSGRTDKGCA